MTDTTLAPLDFSEVLKDADPPELAAFKKKVIAEAKRHSSSFHCGEYKSILRALGIKEKDLSVKVEIESSAGFILDSLGEVGLYSAGKALGIMKINPDTITRMEITAKPVTSAGAHQTPSGLWAYAGPDGRVRHFYYDIWDSGDGAVQYRYRRISRTASTTPTDTHGANALCGYSAWNYIEVDTNRAEDRNCVKCQVLYDSRYAARDRINTAERLAAIREEVS
jgi:hypothetical protein